MNPFNWKREHQVALGIAAVIGAVMGILIGYLVYAVAQGADGAMGFGRGLIALSQAPTTCGVLLPGSDSDTIAG